MKKEYMKPQVEVVSLEIHHMLAASPPDWDGEVGSRESEFFGDDEIISEDSLPYFSLNYSELYMSSIC